jgi:type IV pilus assembly protein PilA
MNYKDDPFGRVGNQAMKEQSARQVKTLRRTNGVNCRRRRNRGGFTLVELLTVVLILAILMAVALPLYLGAVRESTRRTARANMHTIICAQQSYRARYPTLGYTEDRDKLFPADGSEGYWPVGPGNTEYTVHTSGSLRDGRPVPAGGVAVCARDMSVGSGTDYGCFIPGEDNQ